MNCFYCKGKLKEDITTHVVKLKTCKKIYNMLKYKKDGEDMPDISVLKQKCREGRIKWTAHIQERMQERGIEPSDAINCINNGKIIEDYPQAYPYPACLILGTAVNGVYIHVTVGYGEDLLWIITAYQPDENEWSADFTIRKG